jgi:hypothetical protein
MRCGPPIGQLVTEPSCTPRRRTLLVAALPGRRRADTHSGSPRCYQDTRSSPRPARRSSRPAGVTGEVGQPCSRLCHTRRRTRCVAAPEGQAHGWCAAASCGTCPSTYRTVRASLALTLCVPPGERPAQGADVTFSKGGLTPRGVKSQLRQTCSAGTPGGGRGCSPSSRRATCARRRQVHVHVPSTELQDGVPCAPSPDRYLADRRVGTSVEGRGGRDPAMLRGAEGQRAAHAEPHRADLRDAMGT